MSRTSILDIVRFVGDGSCSQDVVVEEYNEKNTLACFYVYSQLHEIYFIQERTSYDS